MASVIFRNRLDDSNPVYAKPGRGTLTHTGLAPNTGMSAAMGVGRLVDTGTVSALSIGGASSGVSLSSVTTPTHGSAFTITGSGFGTHGDFGGSEDFLCKGWNDFTVSMFDGNWIQDGQDPSNCNLSTSSPPGGAITQFGRKTHVSGNQGSFQINTGSNFTGCYYTSFWYRESANSPLLGSAACTKFFRRYLGPNQAPGGHNWYLGPELENATDIVTPPASLNRYSQYPTTPYLPQNTWRFHEIIEFLGNSGGSGVTAYGSADYLELRLSNARLIRRGTGLASNPVPNQGFEANENQQWVADPPEGQSGGVTMLGSHLCETAAGYFMDFAEAYQSYTIARVMLGNASTFTSCTAFYMQIPTAWSSTSITCNANRGANSSFTGTYLYVVNSSNQVNAAGFAL